MISKIDDFLLEIADDYLGFCLDWFGLTKRQVILIHVYVANIFTAVSATTYKSIWFTALIGFFSILIVSNYHITIPSNDRDSRKIYGPLYLAFFFMMIMPPHRHMFFDMSFAFFDINYIFVLYLCASNHDGERGRKAKMAWSKIKELFGTSWTVEPLKIPT